ncbi:MAG TPA: sigma 54-interacting transcriptional regulator [Polyangiaceae bacterium]
MFRRTGGKSIGEAIHEASERAERPFVIVDCGAIPPSLAESTLFGHEKGAFTGATSKRLSPFVEANGGTVFLDELGELPLDIQPKLRRVPGRPLLPHRAAASDRAAVARARGRHRADRATGHGRRRQGLSVQADQP